MFVTSPRDFFTGHFGSAGSIRSVFLACGTIPFLDTSGSKSTFVEKLFFPLVDNKISYQDLGFCSLSSAIPLKFKSFNLGFPNSLFWRNFIQGQIYTFVYRINYTNLQKQIIIPFFFPLKKMDKLGELQFSHLYENCKPTSNKSFLFLDQME